MTESRRKRPRDANQLAKLIVDIATGEAEAVDSASESEKELRGLQRGRPGGLKGGQARASTLTPTRRSEIARKAAEARWGKSVKAD